MHLLLNEQLDRFSVRYLVFGFTGRNNVWTFPYDSDSLSIPIPLYIAVNSFSHSFADRGPSCDGALSHRSISLADSLEF